MVTKSDSVAIVVLALLLTTLGMLGFRSSAEDTDPDYSYRYHDQLIVLKASDSLVAMKADAPDLGEFAASNDWRRDPLSETEALRSNGLVLYRTRPPQAKDKQDQGAAVTAPLMARRAGIPAQPVFELGDALKIPSDEVIVAFDREVTIDDVRTFRDAHAAAYGLLDVRPLRPKTYVIRISAPEDGRAFAASRALETLPGITYAEPNFLVIPLNEPPAPLRPKAEPKKFLPSDPVIPLSIADGYAPVAAEAESLLSPVGWTTVLSEGFESGAPGWRIKLLGVDARPVIQNFRKHAGNAAVYMTGAGSLGVPAPGPYPNNVDTGLIGPVLDLSPYEEAYVEMWFFARYENPNPNPPPPLFDFGLLGFLDSNTGQAEFPELLAVAYTGDLTADPTTQNGWRRVLVRVPPAWRKNNVQVVVRFISDESVSAEGLYVDDVRVVGTADVDTEPLGNDTYGAREYELKNAGQIAGLGGDGNDLNAPEAWAQVSVSNGVVVAVIDSGVDLDHPDLNLVTGYDADTGTVGGAPRDGVAHGTECAGNIGAIRNNGIGTIGTAPGVRIMPIYRGMSEASQAAAIDLAVLHGARVLSNSWGYVGSPSATIEDAIKDALAAGRTVLFAAGNGPDRPPFTYQTVFPCNLTATTDVICVGASSPTDEHKNASSSDGQFTWGSSYIGAGPDVVAPGPWSYTTDLLGSGGDNQSADATGVDTDYTPDFGGTSSATPKVSGIVALMLSKNPNLTPNQVKTILRNTAHDIDAPGFDDRTGAGRVDALAAVNAVSPAVPVHTLTVVKSGTGTGAVTSDPIGISCSDDCTGVYGEGTVVTLNAAAGQNSIFLGFTGDPDCADGIVQMTADRACVANFLAVDPRLDVQLIGRTDARTTGPRKRINFKLKVRNVGSKRLRVVPDLVVVNPDLVLKQAGPKPRARTLKPGRKAAFQWRFKAVQAGAVGFLGWASVPGGSPAAPAFLIVTINP